MPHASGPVTAQRILVYGVTGAGKSTAARRIAELTGLPLVLADELTWKPNWTPVPTDEQRRLFTAITAEERWVLDTAYGQWVDLPLARAEVIVGLDYPRLLSFGRLLRRTLRRWVTQEKVCNGNTEKPSVFLGRDSLFLWHFKSFARKHGRMRAWAAAPEGPPVLLFRRPREFDRWLEVVGRGETGQAEDLRAS